MRSDSRYAPIPAIDSARSILARNGVAKVTFMLPTWVRRAVAAEVGLLVGAFGVRRDLAVPETESTPRRMWNVGQRAIAVSDGVIPELYRSAWLVDGVSMIAGEQARWCPYPPEEFVITRLGVGDTHGWHWDDYSFALVWVVECPEPGGGGELEFVPNAVWNKQQPNIAHIARTRAVRTVALVAGDVYLMRSNTTLHRVAPVIAGRRTILNMAFASVADLVTVTSHETVDRLWSVEGAENDACRAGGSGLG